MGDWYLFLLVHARLLIILIPHVNFPHFLPLPLSYRPFVSSPRSIFLILSKSNLSQQRSLSYSLFSPINSAPLTIFCMHIPTKWLPFLPTDRRSPCLIVFSLAKSLCPFFTNRVLNQYRFKHSFSELQNGKREGPIDLQTSIEQGKTWFLIFVMKAILPSSQQW